MINGTYHQLYILVYIWMNGDFWGTLGTWGCKPHVDARPLGVLSQASKSGKQQEQYQNQQH